MPNCIIYALLVETDPSESDWVRRSLKPPLTLGRPNGTQWRLERAATLNSAIKQLGRKKFDVLLFGLRSSGKNAKQHLQHLRKIAPQIPIIAFVDIEDESILETACALITPGTSQPHQPGLKTFLTAAVLPGRPHTNNGRDIQKLTPREHQIFRLIAEGRTTKEVGEHLSISVKTAETHRSNLMRKLNLRSVSQLVRYAIRHNIVEA